MKKKKFLEKAYNFEDLADDSDSFEGFKKKTIETEEEKPKPKRKKLVEEKKPRKPRVGLGDELIEVYETAGDELSTVTTLEHRKRSWQRMIGWFFLFLLAVFVVVAVISWFMWGDREQFTGQNVTFSIEAPRQANSGDKISYAIEYDNNESISFSKSEIEVRYPPGFIFDTADPKPTGGDNLWDLGSLPPGHNGIISVKGYLVGRPDIDTTISGVFRYWPANFSSEFQEVGAGQTTIDPLNASIHIEGPEQVLVGQAVNYSILVKNNGDDDIKDIRIEVIYPAGFVVEETNPGVSEAANIWDFESISPDAEEEIQIDGFFSAASDDAVDFIVNISQKGPKDDYYRQTEERFATNIVQGDLVANLIANGSTSDQSIQWGDVINVAVNFQNSSELTLSDLKAVLTAETRYRENKAENDGAGALDWEGMVDVNNGSFKDLEATDDRTVRFRSITWTGDDVNELSKLSAEEEGTINFQVSLLSLQKAISNLSYPEDVDIIFKVEVIVGKTGEVAEEMTVAGNPIKFFISSDLKLDAQSRYYSEQGEQLGDGPLPPKVGESTTYRIVWKITNSLHEVKDLIISAGLPSGVAWTNQFDVSAGEMEFRSSANEVTWRLNKMPEDINEAVISFAVELTPTESQIDEVVNLTKKITMTATDSVTGGKIIQTILPLNTGVEHDELAADKGLVGSSE